MSILEELGRPASESELTRLLMEGGFRGGAPGTERQIHKSFRNFISGSGQSKHVIRKVGGLIGRADWDDSHFTSNG